MDPADRWLQDFPYLRGTRDNAIFNYGKMVELQYLHGLKKSLMEFPTTYPELRAGMAQAVQDRIDMLRHEASPNDR